MSTHRWRWQVGDREVLAVLDLASHTESVAEGGATRSTADRGTMPGGHVLGDLVVTFDPYLVGCTLTRGGTLISPEDAPRAPRAPRARGGEGASPSLVLPAAIGALVLAALVFVGFRWQKGRAADIVTHRSEGGAFVARAPARLRAVKEAAPPGTSVLRLEDADSGDAVVVLAEPAFDADAWGFHKRRIADVLTALPRADGTFVETGRRDEACAHERGAVVAGTIRSSKGLPARLFSCAFRREDVGYLVAFVISDGASDERLAELRKVVADLELTRLDATTDVPRTR